MPGRKYSTLINRPGNQNQGCGDLSRYIPPKTSQSLFPGNNQINLYVYLSFRRGMRRNYTDETKKERNEQAEDRVVNKIF